MPGSALWMSILALWQSAGSIALDVPRPLVAEPLSGGPTQTCRGAKNLIRQQAPGKISSVGRAIPC